MSVDSAPRATDVGLALLARMTTLFESASDLDATIRAAAEIAVPDFGDYCTIDLLAPDGRLQRVGSAVSPNPTLHAIAEEARLYAPGAMQMADSPFAEVVRTRRPVLHSVVDDAWLQRHAYSPDHLRLTKSISPISALFSPLLVGDDLLGVIQFCTMRGRRSYDQEAVTIASTVAQRLAMAIYNSRLLVERERELAQRRAVEQTLRASEALLRTVIDASPDFIYARDCEGRVIIANHAGAEAIGRNPSELEGHFLHEFVDEGDAQKLAETDARILREGITLSVERTVDTPAGPRDVHVMNAPLRDRDGAACGVVSISRDVTERNLTRAGIIAREQRISLVLDAAPSGLLLFRCEEGERFRCAEANAGFFSTTGLHRDRLIGALLEEFAAPANLQQAQRMLAQAVATRERVGTPAHEFHVDGVLRLIEANATPIIAADGTVTHVLVATHDVTERELALRAVADSEERYRVLFDSSPVPMWVYARDSLRILEVNNAAVQRYGWSREEFTELSMLDLRRPEDVETFRQRLNDLDSSAVLHTPTRHRLRDGTMIDVDVYGADFLFRGIRSRLVYAADVTAQRQLAAQLFQAQKTEAIGRLAGGIAHDFNNILTVISGFAQLAQVKLAGGDDVHDELEQVLRASDRAASLTRQLLAYSRKQVLQPQLVDINAIVRDGARMLRRLIREDVQLDIALAPHVLTALVDPAQLHTTLVNLVLNARDAMPTGGHILVSTDIALRAGDSPESVRRFVTLSVKDTGRGIDESTRPRLFEPFFTTKEVGKGTGLGLATVFGFITQSGGTIEVDSAPGEGSTFTVFLPQSEAEPSTPNDEKPSKERAATGTILLAEDDPFVRELSTRFLQRGGYEVHAAESGERALEIAERLASIDILVADVIMPGMSGRALAERLMDRYPTLQVLFVSGYTADIMARHGVLDAGMSLLEKPFSSSELLEAVARLATPLRR